MLKLCITDIATVQPLDIVYLQGQGTALRICHCTLSIFVSYGLKLLMLFCMCEVFWHSEVLSCQRDPPTREALAAPRRQVMPRLKVTRSLKVSLPRRRRKAQLVVAAEVKVSKPRETSEWQLVGGNKQVSTCLLFMLMLMWMTWELVLAVTTVISIISCAYIYFALFVNSLATPLRAATSSRLVWFSFEK